MKQIKLTLFLISLIFLLIGCKGGKLPGADARKVPYDPKERVKRNLEQGKGFRINNVLSGKKGGGDFFETYLHTHIPISSFRFSYYSL